MSAIKVLLVEDTTSDAFLIRSHFRQDERFHFTHVTSLRAACELLRKSSVQVVILDLTLPDSTGLQTFVSLNGHCSAPVVILSGMYDESIAVRAVGLGAQDYVLKSNLDHEVLSRSLLYSIERYARKSAERRNIHLEHEIEFAGQIQSHLIPSRPPAIAGFDIAGICHSAERCCGDFFDFITVDRECVDVVVADVSGHGFGPAMVMVGTRRILRSTARDFTSPASILSVVNQSVCEDTLADQFVTLFYLRCNRTTRTIQYSSAGHLALLLHNDGSATRFQQGGLPLGLVAEIDYDESDPFQLQPGELVVLMTDGAWEAMSPAEQQFGLERVCSLLHANRGRSADEMTQLVIDEISDFCGTGRPADDVTMVVLKAE